MKIKILCLILLLNGPYASCQELACEKITNYPSLTFGNYFKTNLPFFLLKGGPLVANGLTITYFNKKQQMKTQDLGKALGRSLAKKIDPRYEFGYLLSKDQLIVKNRNLVFLFEYKDNKFRFKRSIALSLKYQNSIFLKDNILIFYGIYNSHKTEERIPSGYLSYNLDTGKEELKEVPFKYLSLTHMAPHKFMDFNSGGYLVCDPFAYKIYEYDFNNRLKDSICVHDSVFTAAKDLDHFIKSFKAEDLSLNTTEYLESMTTYLNGVDRIWTVNYVDENTLFIRLTRNSLNTSDKKSQLFYDHIWIKVNGIWKLSQVKEIASFNTQQVISERDLWPYFLPGSKNIFTGGSLYYLVWSPSENKFPQSAHDFFGFSTSNRNNLGLKVITFKVK